MEHMCSNYSINHRTGAIRLVYELFNALWARSLGEILIRVDELHQTRWSTWAVVWDLKCETEDLSEVGKCCGKRPGEDMTRLIIHVVRVLMTLAVFPISILQKGALPAAHFIFRVSGMQYDIKECPLYCLSCMSCNISQHNMLEQRQANTSSVLGIV